MLAWHPRMALAVWLSVLLAAAPYPLGSVIPLVAMTFAVLSMATAALAVLIPPVAGRPSFTPVVIAAGIVVLGVMVWYWVQTLPDMGQDWAHPGWAFAPDGSGIRSISIDPDSGVFQLIRFAGYASLFVAVLVTASERKAAEFLFNVITVLILLYSIYGLVAWGLEFETVAGFGPVAYVGDVTSTFVNRNSWATFANLGLVMLLAQLFQDLEDSPGSSLTARLVEIFQNVRPILLLRLMAFFVIGTASILSHSRGGFLSAAVALPLMLIIMLAATRPRASMILASILVAAVAGIWIVAASGEGVLARLQQLDMQFDETSAGRLAAWKICMELIAERPWFGHGLGAFKAIFQSKVDERFTLIYDLAHNTYIEHMVEIGIPATILLYGAIVILFGMCIRGVFRRKRDRIFPLTAVGATLLVGLHALVDFSVQIPAIAMYYSTILAIGCAQARASERIKAVKRRRTSEMRPSVSEVSIDQRLSA